MLAFYYRSIHHLSNYLAITLLFGSPMSNELPVIGSFGLREDFWDRHGAKIATRLKVIYGAFWKLYDTLIIPT